MFSWTPQRVDRLKELIPGKSAGEAAYIVSAEWGYPVTRNSIVSKCGREGIALAPPKGSNQSSPLTKRPRIARNKAAVSIRVFKPRLAPFTPEAAMPVEPLNIPLVDLEPHHCREVVSQDGVIASFCGRDKKEGSSYCPFHSAQNEIAPLPRRPPLFRYGQRAVA